MQLVREVHDYARLVKRRTSFSGRRPRMRNRQFPSGLRTKLFITVPLDIAVSTFIS